MNHQMTISKSYSDVEQYLETSLKGWISKHMKYGINNIEIE